MKLALIKPIPNLHTIEPTGINLLLAPLLESREYMEYYQWRFYAGDFNILDNGAHEGPAMEFGKLLEQSYGVAHEVVIPDTPHDSVTTYRLFYETIQWLNLNTSIYKRLRSPRLVFVPQVKLGRGFVESYVEFAHEMIRLCVTETWVPSSRFTMGVPLMYDTDRENGSILEILGRVVHQCEENQIPIHLLGWSRKMLTPVHAHIHYPSIIRSVDTCKPFVHARYSTQYTGFLDDLASTSYPGRPVDFFTKALTPTEAYIGNYNANILKSLIFDATLPYLSEPRGNMLTEKRH